MGTDSLGDMLGMRIAVFRAFLLTAHSFGIFQLPIFALLLTAHSFGIFQLPIFLQVSLLPPPMSGVRFGQPFPLLTLVMA